ncbi:uncharacterized mitochondrial protein AtMg00820-like [Rutidosis leptorrhynchoides]|uniref:uncharacterized mitochondrial protein AtMg00820-like n=1 Tax=Rutidosis leptorrhynchoides TaxID=125765 RepID=UPI003A991039
MANITQGNLSKEAQKFNSAIYSENIPTSVEQALKSKNWKKAMEVEMEALNDNDTWEKCVIPQGKKPVGNRWVFTIKYKPDGTIERYKARLVAKDILRHTGLIIPKLFHQSQRLIPLEFFFLSLQIKIGHFTNLM